MDRKRVVIEGIEPQVDGGRYPAKGIVGERVVVEADAFTDGHDAITVRLLHRRNGTRRWQESAMAPLGNDRWRGGFDPDELGRYQFTVEAWVDPFLTWQRDMAKRVAAAQDVAIDLRIGAALVREAAARAAKRRRGDDAERLEAAAAALEGGDVELALSADLLVLVSDHPERSDATRAAPVLEVRIDRPRAGFSAWYEFFPRSCGKDGRHATFEDCVERLDYVASMGFDVVYLPPIHPIGVAKRKGRNNAVVAEPGDLGSPWAIGSAEGGHKAIHPALGTQRDFRRFRKEAEKRGLELALDVAFQVSPDHPYVKAHPEWFRARPDGTVQYAENPPKKYEDIYPFDFESDDWKSLWRELKSVFDFWIDQGVRIFRVDNPHTKAFPFWEWCVAEIEREHPDVILLAEAFTRPKVMYRLAKLGYHQSYTYFAWRYSKWDFETYMKELTGAPVRHFFRPNFWPNTPDILTEQLQTGGRPVFMQRLVLAATLSANYGIYGPAFELVETRAREPGSEEYLDSEKYQLRDWDVDARHSLRHFIARVNRIRRGNPALQRTDNVRFVDVDSEMLLAYLKVADEVDGPRSPGSSGVGGGLGGGSGAVAARAGAPDRARPEDPEEQPGVEESRSVGSARTEDPEEQPGVEESRSVGSARTEDPEEQPGVEESRSVGNARTEDPGEGDPARNIILVVVNLDSHHPHSGWVRLPLEDLGIDPDEPYQAHDLLGGGRYQWRGHRNYVELNPHIAPAHIFRIERRARSETNFDYYL